MEQQQKQETDGSCLTCFQSRSSSNLLSAHQQDIAETLVQHFWFTKAELERASLCAPCWEVISDFHRFYANVEKLHNDRHYPKPTQQIDVKCELEEEGTVEYLDESSSQLEEDRDLAVKREEDSGSIDLPVQVKFNEEHDDEEELQEDEDQEEVVPLKRVRRTSKRKLEEETKPKRPYPKLPLKTQEDRLKEDDFIKQHAKYICEDCGTISETYRLFQKHARETHGNKNPYVACCGKRFYKKVRLYQHVQTIYDPDAFRCEICQKNYGDAEGIKRHKREFHTTDEEKKFKCERCDKKFAIEFLYNQHMRDHEDWDSQSCKCEHCGKISKSRSILKNHIKLFHTTPTDFICDICAKGFHLKSQFLKHKMEHEAPDELKMQCEVCLRWLKNRENWRRHMLQHRSGEVTCDICGHVSPHARALTGHKRRQHLRQKSTHACTLCPKTFSTAITLKEHVAALHTGDVLYNCSFCEKTFNSNSNMHSHQKRMHPKEWLEEHKKKFYSR